MKKQILISTALVATIWGGTALAVINNTNAESSKQPESKLLSENSTLNLDNNKILTTDNETVFVIADETGAEKSKFIGNTLYTGTEELPFNFRISYFLNNEEVSAKDLAGKSGHVKIVYSYSSNKSYLGNSVPFVALTGLILDHNNFTNIKLTNGKIITETSDNYIITGYATTGLNNNLGTNFLPESFTLEADTTNFKLANSYTIFTNDLIADLDTSKLNTIDGLINSVYELDEGLNKIVAGSSELSNGLLVALNGTKALYDGSTALSNGASAAANGAAALSDGLNTLASNNDTIQYGANTIVNTILEKANDALNLLKEFGLPIELNEITKENYSYVYSTFISNKDSIKQYIGSSLDNLGLEDNQKLAISNLIEDSFTALASIKSIVDLNLGIVDYTNGVEAAAAGATELSNGLSELSTGAATLSNGLGELVEGTTKLYNGSVTLKDGLGTFKTSGIDKLVDFASKDLTRFTANLRNSVSAAASYKNFGGTNAKSVKFIIKTPSI
ncbi:hypothetical protein IJ076_02800 [Candidatus Saccharibacteria bacterium]|nr:hypothetical protein [Candidatus Saccharibacteria bacterium]